MPTNALILVALAWAVSAGLMLGLWLWHLRSTNAAIVDVGWAGGLAVVALLDAVLGPGDLRRRWLVGLMMAAWGSRLAVYLLVTRVIGHGEDPRYARLRQSRGDRANGWFFWFFQGQAVLVAMLSWPVAVAAVDPNSVLSRWLWTGVVVWGISIAGETVADRQLHTFKATPANRGRTCRTGLWRYSRHPNYFFEWLVWVAYALVATGSPGGLASWFAPVLMLYFLCRVTGIPATEAQALRSRGDEYREYQRTTSAFVPWFSSR